MRLSELNNLALELELIRLDLPEFGVQGMDSMGQLMEKGENTQQRERGPENPGRA